MLRKSSLIVIVSAFSLLLTGILHAADQQANSPEARLREALRSMALQLRSAQAERDTLKAQQAENDQAKKDLTAQLDALTKQSKADKDADSKCIADLNAKVADQTAKIAQLTEASSKWEAAYNKTSAALNDKEAERAKLASEVIELQRKVADRESKNLALLKLGKEILSRYEKFGLGTALTAREPFVGLTRVKLESLVQDYSDKLMDQRVKP